MFGQTQGGGMGFGFNPAEVPDNDNLPDGDYPVRLTGFEVKQKDDGSSTALVATFTVLAGNFANRKHFERYTMQHPKPDAVRVGQQNLKKLFVALGYTRPLSTLQDIETFKAFAAQNPLTITVKNKGDFANVTKYTGQGGGNALSQPVSNLPPQTSGFAASPAATGAPAGGVPWGAQAPAA